MSVTITRARHAELPAVLALNEREVPHVGQVDIERMRWFAEHADFFGVAWIDDELAGFLIGLRPGSEYQSPNYRWFCERYADFAYVDRVAVAPSARRHGVASALYGAFADAMPASVGRMTCEVNVIPPNESSMKFHRRLDFYEVGTLDHDDGKKKVAMLVKDL